MGHLREAGLNAKEVSVSNLAAIKRKHGVSPALGSCHTAIVEGYVVEGHVPADVVWKLLTERPDVVGIAVPDMPLGSPGMEAVSYTHLTLPTSCVQCRSRWAPEH